MLVAPARIDDIVPPSEHGIVTNKFVLYVAEFFELPCAFAMLGTPTEVAMKQLAVGVLTRKLPAAVGI